MNDFTNKEKQQLKDLYAELREFADYHGWSNSYILKQIFNQAKKDRGADSARLICLNGFIYGVLTESVKLEKFSHFAHDFRELAIMGASMRHHANVKLFATSNKAIVENIQIARIDRISA